MEEGEIQSGIEDLKGISVTGKAYDPAYEWPGESSFTPAICFPDEETTSDIDRSNTIPKSNQPTFRLVVLRSSILPSKHKMAIVDGYSEVQFGRDIAVAGSSTPRIRLKEMEVSKLHATAYWDGARREWGIVDMGSKHGTYLRTGSSTPKVDNPGVRLSPPRVASIPKRLRHNDLLTIGTTTFIVHIHDSQIPCASCSPQANQEIPLFTSQLRAQASSSAKRTREVAGLDEGVTPYISNKDRDPKKALHVLKRNLLTRHETPTHSPLHFESAFAPQYFDRAARRRALISASHPDAPGVPILPMSTVSTTESRVLSGMELPSPVPPPVSQTPAPLSSANVGHRLLMKQGWLPGEPLGLGSNEDRTALVEPLNVTATVHRAGLGVKKSSLTDPSEATYGDNWKERKRNKRFQQLRQDTVDRDN
ncbi:hypothetical protein BDQ17DRAFT_1436184 [Cyathus striatus]|nr:hypothetical protein BDQ17DRAFT_1436184 [Cyathus striatus]